MSEPNYLEKLMGRKIWLFIFPLLIIISLAYYHKGFGFYFQRDGWHFLGYYKYLGSRSLLDFFYYSLNESINYSGLFHIAPLSRVFFYLQYLIFRHNYLGYFMVAILIHSTNALLIYLLVKKILDWKVGLVSSVIFATYSSHYQAVTLTSAYTPTLLSTSFILLSLICFYKYIEVEKTKFVLLSSTLFFIALLFKEIALFLYLFIPLFLVIYGKINLIRNRSKDFLYFSILPVLYMLFRFYMLFIAYMGGQYGQDVFFERIAPGSQNSVLYLLLAIFSRAILVPLKGFLQSLISIKLAVDFLKIMENYLLGKTGIYFTSWVPGNIVLVTLSLSILFLIFIYQRFIISKNYKRFIIFSTLLALTAAESFIIIPGPRGKFLFFESRNLYVLVIGISMLGGFIFVHIFNKLNNSKLKSAWLILLIAFLGLHFYQLQKYVLPIAEKGKQLKAIAEGIKSFYPTIDKTTVFYIAGEETRPKLSGLFGSGLVWNLKVLYSDYLPEKFFKDKTSYINNYYQGIEEIDGYKFGVYYSFEDLRQAINNDKELAFEDVNAVYIDMEDLSVRDGSDYLEKVISLGGVGNVIKSWTGVSGEGEVGWFWYDLDRENKEVIEYLSLTDDYLDNLILLDNLIEKRHLGPFIKYYLHSGGGYTVQFPINLYGYETIHIESIRLSGVRVSPVSIDRDENYWNIGFGEMLGEDEIVEFDLIVLANQVYVRRGGKDFEDLGRENVRSISSTLLLKGQIVSESEVVFSSERDIVLMPLENPKSPGAIAVYVDGEMYITRSFELSEGNMISVELPVDLIGIELIEMPVLTKL